MMSSWHGNNESMAEKHSDNITKPSVIMSYDNNVRGGGGLGVDKHDEYLPYYAINKNGKRRFFSFVRELCI